MSNSQRTAVIFVGPMGAGKTKIGRYVARSLGRDFVDTDAVIVERFGPITQIFADRGEAAFREIERDIVAEAARGDAIVSLGGGAVLDASTRAVLRDLPVVHLTVTEAAVLARINVDKRPLLRDDPTAWARIAAEREHLYTEVATTTVDTSVGTVAELGDHITTWIKENA